MVTRKAVIDVEVDIPVDTECFVDSVVVKYSDGSCGDHIVPAEHQSMQVAWEEEE